MNENHPAFFMPIFIHSHFLTWEDGYLIFRKGGNCMANCKVIAIANQKGRIPVCPVKFAAVHNGATDLRRMAVHIF